MPIRVECATCGSAFRVDEKYAGRKGRCPKCGDSVPIPDETVPEPSPAPVTVQAPSVDSEEDGTGIYEVAGAVPRAAAVLPERAPRPSVKPKPTAPPPDEPTLTPTEILCAFGDPIPPVRPSWLYRLWLLIVAGAMVILPLIYIALIVVVGTAVYYHATNNYTVFDRAGRGAGNAKGAALVYIGPLVVGVLVVVFMIKPIFARPSRASRPQSLDPTKEPLLFAFVDGVCLTVGAPVPSRIDVDCDVNASASFARGAASFLSNDLVLTVGLPLVSGMNLRQFAGVLAHEFGHFSQSAGMRLTYLIRSINGWFARVVYERDSWDESLAAWSGGGHIAVILVVYLARAMIWVTRKILWLLMMIGHLISSVMLRQMEYDADRYEARMSGSDVFETTTRRLSVLNLASRGAYVDLREGWKEGRLADDLPQLVLANVSQIPPQALDQLNTMIDKVSTGLFATHPADKDRIRQARAENAPGVFHLDGPATAVFRNFEALCKSATLRHYQGMLGPGISQENLMPVDAVVQGTEAVAEGNQALERFFAKAFRALRPLPLPTDPPKAGADPKAAFAALKQARLTVGESRVEYEGTADREGKLHARLIEVGAAALLLKADFKIKAAEFELPASGLETAEAEVRRTSADLEQLNGTLVIFEEAMVRRLISTFELLESGALAKRLPEADRWRDDVRALYPAASLIGSRVLPDLPAVIEARMTLIRMLGKLSDNQKNEKLHNAILRGARQLRDRLQEISWKFGNAVIYPFEHARGEISLGRFVMPNEVPAHEDIGGLLEVSGELLDKLLPLYCRILGRLALAAEEVERALNLEPLEVPESVASES